MSTHTDPTRPDGPATSVVTRREAIFRVSALLGGAALIGGSGLLAACGRADDAARTGAAANGAGPFTPQDIAFLDEVADTILPDTARSPGAKAAQTGAFMALMVTDTYAPGDQDAFRAGMKTLDEACRKAHDASFVAATPQQRLALLETLDREQHDFTRARDEARNTRAGEVKSQEEAEQKAAERLPDERKEGGTQPTAGAGGAPAISADAPNHYFRMMKELALLGYFTSEIGYTKAMRYVESPGRFDPCAPHAPGDVSWAPHA